MLKTPEKLVGLALVLALGLAGCGSEHPSTLAPGSSAPAVPAVPYEVTATPLPGAPADGLFLDYLAFDPATGFVWVPAGATGSVDVLDTATRKLTRVEGFPTREMERNGKKRVVGPSAVTIGRGVVYVGNRAD